MPPVFGLPPAIQKISLKLASALAAQSALVAFESLTNSTLPLRPIGCMRWARPGKLASPFWIAGRSRPSATQAAMRGAAFCALCAPRKRADAGELRHRHAPCRCALRMMRLPSA